MDQCNHFFFLSQDLNFSLPSFLYSLYRVLSLWHFHILSHDDCFICWEMQYLLIWFKFSSWMSRLYWFLLSIPSIDFHTCLKDRKFHLDVNQLHFPYILCFVHLSCLSYRFRSRSTVNSLLFITWTSNTRPILFLPCFASWSSYSLLELLQWLSRTLYIPNLISKYFQYETFHQPVWFSSTSCEYFISLYNLRFEKRNILQTLHVMQVAACHSNPISNALPQ